jgi:hypothetical protein
MPGVKRAGVLLALALVTAQGIAAQDWQLAPKKLKGAYSVYGGGLAAPVAPSSHDTKILFALEGQAAKEIFDAIGPDIKSSCNAQSGERMRKKDSEHIACSLNAKGDYFCSLGFDLRTGKSIGGIAC